MDVYFFVAVINLLKRHCGTKYFQMGVRGQINISWRTSELNHTTKLCRHITCRRGALRLRLPFHTVATGSGQEDHMPFGHHRSEQQIHS